MQASVFFEYSDTLDEVPGECGPNVK